MELVFLTSNDILSSTLYLLNIILLLVVSVWLQNKWLYTIVVSILNHNDILKPFWPLQVFHGILASLLYKLSELSESKNAEFPTVPLTEDTPVFTKSLPLPLLSNPILVSPSNLYQATKLVASVSKTVYSVTGFWST